MQTGRKGCVFFGSRCSDVGFECARAWDGSWGREEQEQERGAVVLSTPGLLYCVLARRVGPLSGSYLVWSQNCVSQLNLRRVTCLTSVIPGACTSAQCALCNGMENATFNLLLHSRYQILLTVSLHLCLFADITCVMLRACYTTHV